MQTKNLWKVGAALLMACAGSTFAAITSVTWSVNNATRTHVFTRGTPIAPDTATILATMAASPNGCGVVPALPAGLVLTQLSTTQCTITGTPTVTAPTTIYHVHFRAANGADSVTFKTITVGPVTNLSYPTKLITATVGKSLTVTPTLGLTSGTIVYSADSALPAGLSLASGTGVISGSASAAFAGRNYVVTATNGTDTTTTSVRIEAKAAVSYTAWSGHKIITVNPTGLNLGAPVSNFPVLVRLTGANSDVFTASKTGADVRFTAADSASPLSFQIERWDSTAKVAEVWVNVPSVSNTANTTFIMHYGMTGQTTASNGPATFSTANGFQAVWHMNAADTALEKDATANAINATPNGGATSIAGIVGPARGFNGTSSYLEALGSAGGPLNFPQNSSFTISAWASTPTGANRISIVSKSNFQYALQTSYSTPTQWETVEYQAIPQPTAATVLRGGWPHAFSPTDSVKADVWTHLVSVINGGALYMYVNGNLAASAPPNGNWDANGTTARVTANNVVIGAMFENSGSTTFARGWDGKIDEVQMANVARDSNWVRLSYATQRATNSVVSVAGTVITVPDAPTGVTGVAGSAAGSIVVSWTAGGNGGSPITGYKAYAVSDTSKSCTTTGALTCSVTGLTAGAYTFQVKATNSVGTSAASVASPSVTGIAAVRTISNLFSASVKGGHIAFSLPEGAQAGRILISDMLGRQVWSMNVAANGKASWNGVLANGKPLNNGTYMVRFLSQDSKTWESKLDYTR